MRPDRPTGFTLIEVLISITLAVALSGLAVTGFNQMRQVARRNQAMTDLAIEAAYIHRRMAEDLAVCQQTSQLRLERRPAIAATGYPAYAVRLFFFSELPSIFPTNALENTVEQQESDTYLTPNVWSGWEWRPPTATSLSQVGTFSIGRSSRVSRMMTREILGVDYEFYQRPDARRSRQRHPDDNDLRLLPNAGAARTAAGLPAGTSLVTGDYSDVFGEDADGDGVLDAGEDANGNTVLDPGNQAPLSLRMKSLELSWATFGGADGTLTAASGISPTGSDAWWTSDLYVADGLYRDGRIEPASLLQARPGLLRVRFTLMDPTTRIERTFSFSFNLGLESPATAGGL